MYHIEIRVFKYFTVSNKLHIDDIISCIAFEVTNRSALYCTTVHLDNGSIKNNPRCMYFIVAIKHFYRQIYYVPIITILIL